MNNQTFQPEIETLSETVLAGKKVRMSFAQNQTRELWQSFMPRRAEITHSAGPELYSAEVYDDLSFFRNFDPAKAFDKWAAVKVTGGNALPAGLETLIIPEGLYAVFHYKGKSSDAPAMYQYIFGRWIPQSGYELDHRPHFAVMGEKYRNDHPDSEEELWIPVRPK